MNCKKVLTTLIIAIVFTIFILSQGVVYAQTQSPSVSMSISELMVDNPRFGYAIGKPGDSTGKPGYKVWNIKKQANTIAFETAEIYCIKEGVGFTATDSNGQLKSQSYNRYYNMKTERNTIKTENTNDKVAELMTKQTSDGKILYNALLALLDKLYLPSKLNTDQKNTKRAEIKNILMDEIIDNAETRRL